MKLKDHIEELRIIDNQRKGWLVLSSLVVASIIGIIFGWEQLHSNPIVWLIVAGGLLISMTWWYWTMRLVRHLIHYKTVESEILMEIVEDIRHVKNEVKKISPTPIDKDK